MPGLAEGLHWKAFIVGFATLWGCLLLMRFPSAARIGERYFNFLSRAAGKLGIAPTDIHRESIKTDLIRVIVGALVIYRDAPTFAYAWTSGSPEQVAAGAGGLLLASFLVIGFATPLVAALLTVLVSPIIDTYLGNTGIASLIISMTALCFAVMPAGTTLSLDAYLLNARLGAPIRFLYSRWGAPSLDRARVARLLPLLAFAAISAGSAMDHIHEPRWQDGEMVGLLFLLPLMNPGSYELFGALSQRAPELYRYLSIIATHGMLVWQLLMIPMLLVNRYTRLLCILWGIPFFVASQHVLNIKMLGVFEYVLWALIFINIPGKASEKSETARVPDSSGDGSGSDVARAFAMSFTVLLVCFLVQVPSLTGWVTRGPVARLVELTVYPAPLVYGLSKVDVFNKDDLEVYMHWVPLFVKEADGRLAPAALMPQNETTASTLTTVHRAIARQPIYCGARLVTEALRLLPPGHPYRAETLRADFYAIALPDHNANSTTASEGMFRLLCSVEGRFDATGVAHAHTELSDLGTRLIRASFVDDPRVDGAWLDSVQNFPCAAESDRVAFWFDHVNKVPVSETGTEAVRVFLRASQVSESMGCLRAFETMRPLMPSYPASGALPPGQLDCEIDSSIAATLADSALTADQRPAAQKAAGAAQVGNFEECARQSATVRQAYFEKVVGTARFTAAR